MTDNKNGGQPEAADQDAQQRDAKLWSTARAAMAKIAERLRRGPVYDDMRLRLARMFEIMAHPAVSNAVVCAASLDVLEAVWDGHVAHGRHSAACTPAVCSRCLYEGCRGVPHTCSDGRTIPLGAS